MGFTDPKLGGLLLLLLFGLGGLLLLLLFVGGLLFWAKAGAAITANITAISAATATTVMMRLYASSFCLGSRLRHWLNSSH